MNSISLTSVLLHTAHRTRPPAIHGFHLSDYWAWLRYFPAFDPSRKLQLRREWHQIDSHQKTVLSDEIGMGACTKVLDDIFKFKAIADTNHFIRVLQLGGLSYLSPKKRGPAKSPDFIATDHQNNLYIIECKGTQTSRRALTEAMGRGLAQKNNVMNAGRHKIVLSVVAGLFIPQHGSKEDALIRFDDPTWDEMGSFMDQADPMRIQTAICRIDLAKHFALLGLPRSSAWLGGVGPHLTRSAPEDVQREIRMLLEPPKETDQSSLASQRARMTPEGQITRTITHPLGDLIDYEEKFSGSFRIEAPMSLLEPLCSPNMSIDAFVQDALSKSSEVLTEEKETEKGIWKSPLGFTLSLSYPALE